MGGGYENNVPFWRCGTDMKVRIAVAMAIGNQTIEAPKEGVIGCLDEAAVKEVKTLDWSDVSLFQ